MNQYKSIPLLSSLLSEQDRLVLGYMCRGWSTEQISEAMDITLATTYEYRKRVLRKLGARNTAHLISIVKKAKIASLQQRLEATQVLCLEGVASGPLQLAEQRPPANPAD